MNNACLTENDIRTLVDGLKARSRKPSVIEKILKQAGIRYRKDMECGYFNLRIPLPDGTYIRIYQNMRREIVIQKFEKVTFTYSGVPTFEPSGRHSI